MKLNLTIEERINVLQDMRTLLIAQTGYLKTSSGQDVYSLCMAAAKALHKLERIKDEVEVMVFGENAVEESHEILEYLGIQNPKLEWDRKVNPATEEFERDAWWPISQLEPRIEAINDAIKNLQK